MGDAVQRVMRATFIVAAIVFALGWGSVAFAADAPEPAIRSFDLATIEKLGREIYEQDQLALKATGVLAAKYAQVELRKAGLQRWITGRAGADPLVRFIRVGDKGPEALYDVRFPAGGEPVLSTPADRTLTSEEAAQYEARELALKTAANKCSPIYNTVALKDPAGDGWLVWALAATTDPDPIIVGGHIRFTISADGKTVQARDDLSKGCNTFSKSEVWASGGRVVGLFLSHIVSLAPVETHLFTSLTYKIVMYIGTLDGVAWKLGAGHIAIVDMDSAGADGFAARALAGFAEECTIIASKIGEDPPRYSAVGELRVILSTEDPGPFRLQIPGGYKANSVVCRRLDIVPAPYDYKVLEAGYPLYVGDVGIGHPFRMAALEMSDGKFRYRLENGPPLTAEQSARVGKRLDAFQAATAKVAMKGRALAPRAGDRAALLAHVRADDGIAPPSTRDDRHEERAAYIVQRAGAGEGEFLIRER